MDRATIPVSDVLREEADLRINVSEENAEGFYDWNPVDGSGFAEGYMRGQLALHVHYAEPCVSADRVAVPSVCAMFVCRRGADPLNGSVVEPDRRSDLVFNVDDVQHETPVFVDVVEFGDNAQRVVTTRVPSVVRLRTLDQCCDGTTGFDPLNISLITGRLVFLRPLRAGVEDRELGMSANRASIAVDKERDDVIEGRAQMEQDFSSDYTEQGRHGAALLTLAERFRGIGIVSIGIDKYSVRCFFKKGVDVRIQLLDVLCGPV